MFKWVRRALVLAAVALLALSLNALAEGDGNTTYRAMLIGNDNYDSNALNGCVTDANRMLATLQAANEAGAIYQTPTIRTNLKAADMSALIGELTTWGVDDDDVTLFYFAGHGYATEDSGVPCFVGTDTKALRMDKLKSAMDGVPGTKLIVLDCRYADLLISKSGESADSMLKKFNQAVIDLFPAEEDYYVLTSSALASSVEGAKAEDGSARGLTTYYLVNACGYDYVKQLPTDALLGDADQNGAVSFAEARDSVNEQVKNLAAQTGAVIALDVQISPADSTYPLIARRAATEVLGVTLDREQATVAIGYTQKLGAEISPANASKNAIHWSSSDLGVATVDDKGLVTGVRAGRAQIVATAANGLTARCDVDVRDVTFAESIEMQASKLVIGEQTGAQLNLSFDPPEANETITWKSSDASVATVDEKGYVTARAIGAATVTARTERGKEAVCAIQVVDKAKVVTAIKLDASSLEVYEGHAQEIKVKLTPSDAADSTITWQSTDPEVAHVNEQGLLVAEQPGETTLTAIASSGVSAECKVTVKAAELLIDPKYVSLKQGKAQQLQTKIQPAGVVTDITWESADPAVATVDDKGKVSAVALGTTRVTATLESGMQASCLVSVVKVPVTKVAVNKTAAKMTVGQQVSLKSKVGPGNADVKTVTWESSDPSIATVDENGQITAVGVGKCTIKAVAHSGVSAKCKLAVSAAAVKAITLSETSATLIAGMEGQNTLQLTAETEPVSANGNRAVKWKSSDKKVATVDDNGLVTAKSAGKAIIRATAAGGKTKADCKITVESNSAAYKKATVGDEQLVFTSARRIYYKGGYLVVEMYFANNTGSTVKLPEPGMLTLELANGDQFELKQLEQGKKKLKNKAIGTAEYRFKLSDNAQLSGLDLRGATATIVTEGGVANTPSVDAFGTPAPTKPADDPQVGDEPGADDQD